MIDEKNLRRNADAFGKRQGLPGADRTEDSKQKPKEDEQPPRREAPKK